MLFISLLILVLVVGSIFLGDIHEVKGGSAFFLSVFSPLNISSTSFSATVMTLNLEQVPVFTPIH